MRRNLLVFTFTFFAISLNAQIFSEDFNSGSYFLTTQKILQEQYIKDFGSPGPMKSIKSSSNYNCRFNKGSSCADNQRALKVTDKSSSFFRT